MTIWGRSSSISPAACKLAAATSPPAPGIPVAEVPGAADRERWKTATAGEKPEEPEQTRDREGGRRREKRRRAHSHRGGDRKAWDRSGHYGGEARWSSGGSPRIRRTPTQPGIASQGSSAHFGDGNGHTAPPSPLGTLSWGVRDLLLHTHTGGAQRSSHRVDADIKGGTGRRSPAG